jgi:hypothetical protein
MLPRNPAKRARVAIRPSPIPSAFGPLALGLALAGASHPAFAGLIGASGRPLTVGHMAELALNHLTLAATGLTLHRGHRRRRAASSLPSAPSAASESAMIGRAPSRILTTLRLPLGAPALIGGLRVATVQALGLATLGALVGAGGLGTLVFDGMAQFAPDLILLGALPIIALSLAAEGALGRLEAWRPAGHR